MIEGKLRLLVVHTISTGRDYNDRLLIKINTQTLLTSPFRAQYLDHTYLVRYTSTILELGRSLLGRMVDFFSGPSVD